MIKRLFFFGLILIVIGYAVGELLAKQLVERKIAEFVVQRDPLVRNPKVLVSAPVLAGLLFGDSIRKIQVDAANLPLGSVTAGKATATFDGTHLDRGASLSAGKPVISSIDTLKMSLEISDTEASKILPTGFKFEFAQDEVTIKGAGIALKGRVTLVGPHALKFESQAGRLPFGVQIPLLKLQRLPFASCLDQISTVPGLLRAGCTQRNPPVSHVQ